MFIVTNNYPANSIVSISKLEQTDKGKHSLFFTFYIHNVILVEASPVLIIDILLDAMSAITFVRG